MTPREGTKLGPYRVTAQIDAGGVGEVYHAHGTESRRDSATEVSREFFVPQIAQALQAAHGKGIIKSFVRILRTRNAQVLKAFHEEEFIHRDLKLANWKLTPRGKVKAFKETEDE